MVVCTYITFFKKNILYNYVYLYLFFCYIVFRSIFIFIEMLSSQHRFFLLCVCDGVFFFYDTCGVGHKSVVWYFVYLFAAFFCVCCSAILSVCTKKIKKVKKMFFSL